MSRKDKNLISGLEMKSSGEMSLSALKKVEKLNEVSLLAFIFKNKSFFSLKYESASTTFLYLLCFPLSQERKQGKLDQISADRIHSTIII